MAFSRVQSFLSAVHLARGADVIYAAGMFLEAMLASTVLSKPFALRFVGDEAWETAFQRGWTDKDFLQFQADEKDWRCRLANFLRTAYVRRANLVITPCHFLSKVLHEWIGPATPIRTVYNAVEPDTDFLQPPALPQELDGKTRILMACRLVRHKRVADAIEAVAQLPQFALIIAGDGPERPFLQERVRFYKLQDRVLFLGRQHPRAVVGLLQSCHIFLQCSTYEGFPHAVLEAMKEGVGVVATNVGGTSELIRAEETGLLFEPGDVEGLKLQLLRLHGDTDLMRKVVHQACRFARNFSSERMVEETEQLLLELR